MGAFADERSGFPGFTVGPGKTLTVKVRLALTSDAVPNEVTANAAIVQRRESDGDGDGDWIGQSDDYRFAIGGDLAPRPTLTPTPGAAVPATPTASPTGGLPSADGASTGETSADEAFVDKAEELALTGLGPTGGALAGAAALLLVAVGALLVARRRR